MNPYLILDVPDHADDATIRAAYLAQIRRHTPDADPEGFSRVQEAYQSIKDLDARCQWWFLHRQQQAESPIALLIQREQSRPHPARSWNDLRNFLRQCTNIRS